MTADEIARRPTPFIDSKHAECVGSKNPNPYGALRKYAVQMEQDRSALMEALENLLGGKPMNVAEDEAHETLNAVRSRNG